MILIRASPFRFLQSTPLKLRYSSILNQPCNIKKENHQGQGKMISIDPIYFPRSLNRHGVFTDHLILPHIRQ